MRTIFILIAFFVESSLCKAQPVILVEKQTFVNVGKAGYFWQDSLKTTPFAKVEQLKPQDFTQGQSAIFNGGTRGKVWWMKLRFHQNPQTQPYLFIDHASIDSLSLFYRDTLGMVKQLHSGMCGSQQKEAILGTGYVFSLQQVKGPVGEIYLRAHAMNTLLLPVKLVTEPVLNRALIREYSIQFIYLGIALMILIFHIFMFFITRSKLFSLYIARIILLYFIAVAFYLQGYGLLLGHQAAKFIFLHAYVFIALGYISTILFNNYFLKIKRQLPQLHKIFNILIIGWCLIIFCSLWDMRTFINVLTQILFLLTSILFLFSSIQVIVIRGYARKNALIWCYVMGWIPVTLVSIYLAFCLIELIPFQSYSFNLLTFAGIIEGILISLGLFSQRLRLLGRHNAHFRRQRILLQEQMESYRKQLYQKAIVPVEPLSLKALIELAHSGDPSFMKRFRETEPAFTDALFQVSPHLLPAELELCAYIRLNFDTKEIARTCKLSVRAVESRKYRIRKKLMIDGETNMHIWMLGLSNRPK
jgi:DNA-binding CsgD family transcriptional regulator